MADRGNNKEASSLRWTLIILGAVLIILVGIFVHQAITLWRANLISVRESWVMAHLGQHGPLTAADLSVIRSWMTFDYINKLFAVPPDYLKTTLNITDIRYPKMSISSFGKDENESSTAALDQVVGALQNYFTSNGASI